MNAKRTKRIEIIQKHLHSCDGMKSARLRALLVKGLQVLACLLACSLLPTMVEAQNGPFLNLSAVPVGASPNAVAIGDLNGDGIPDAAVTNSADSTVSILLGNGDGSFNIAGTISVGTSPGAVAIADLNKDGKGDLVVGTITGKTIQIFLGNGDGTFGSPLTLNVGGSVAALQVADFNGDGKLDIAFVSQDSISVGVLLFLGKGDGTFAFMPETVGFAGGASALGSLVAGDFDGNGTIDVALAATVMGTNTVAIYLNDGTGKFSNGTSISLHTGLQTAIAAGDFNGDGHIDLAVGSGPSNVAIMIGNGDGTFQSPVYAAVGAGPIYIAAADINGDGKIDLVTSNQLANSLSVLLGNGDGTFQNSKNYSTLAGPFGLAAADLNADGRADLVVADAAQGTAQPFLATSTGSLITGTYATSAYPGIVVTGDFNGDGLPDIAVLSIYEDTFSVYFGDGHGGFSTLPDQPACPDEYGTASYLASGHFLNLTSDQILVGCQLAPAVFQSELLIFYPGSGDYFTSLPTLDVADAHSLAVADLNGDGYTDILSIDGNGVLSYSLTNPSYSGPETVLGSNAVSLDSIVPGDFNGDGKIDVGLAGVTGSVSSIFLSNAMGSFTAVLGTFPASNIVLSGDMNGDGLADILLDLQTLAIDLQLSNGDGTFRTGVGLSGSDNSDIAATALGDFNGDGVLDILTAKEYGRPYNVFLGAPDGSFTNSGLQFGTFTGSLPVVADFNQDGSPDLALIDYNTGTMTVLLNKNHFLPTNTTISNLSPMGVVTGQGVTLSANVIAKTGTATGQIIFKQDGVPETNVALSDGSAQALLSSPLTIGAHRFTALYTGDGTYSGSLSPALIVTVSQARSTTTLTSTSSAPKSGQSFSVTAIVAPQITGTPTGTIQYYADGEPFASSPLVNGQAIANYAAPTMGKHKIEAIYSGDASFLTSVGVLTVNVGKAASTVTLSSSANPAMYGSGVTLTANVTDSDGTIATGPVVFKEGTTIYGSVILSGGSAQLTLPSLTIGSHKITAQYGGDAQDGSVTGTLTQVIQGTPTTTTVITSSQPSIFGQSVTFTATISVSTGTPDGAVTFKNGSAVLGTAPVSGGQAQLSISTLAAGTHTITALYNGGSAYAGSSGTVQQIIEKATTSVALSSSSNPAATGSTVTFTVTVASAAAQIPTGNVTFKSGKSALGTVALVNGQAQLSTSLLPTGTLTITANYAATTDFSASTSSLTQTMQ